MANTFNRYFRKNTGTVAETVITVPIGTTMTIIGCTLANVSNASIQVDVFVRAAGVDYYILKGAETPVGAAQVPIGGDQKVVLLPGDAFFVKSSAASSLDVVLSTLNIT